LEEAQNRGIKRAKDRFTLAMLAAGKFPLEEIAELVEYPL